MITRQEASEALETITKDAPSLEAYQGAVDDIRSYLNQCGEPVAYQWRMFRKADEQWYLVLDWREGRAPENAGSDYVRVEERELFLGSSRDHAPTASGEGVRNLDELGIQCDEAVRVLLGSCDGDEVRLAVDTLYGAFLIAAKCIKERPTVSAAAETPPLRWPVDTDDQVEALARECDWDNRKWMTAADYSIWCNRMRKFAALSRRPVEARPEHTAWLIEKAGDPKWFNIAKDGLHWTRDANQALHFARREDAERFSQWCSIATVTPCVITEHMWPSADLDAASSACETAQTERLTRDEPNNQEPVAWTTTMEMEWLKKDESGRMMWLTHAKAEERSPHIIGREKTNFPIPLFTHPQKEWQPMSYAPTDGTPILATLVVRNTASGSETFYWETHVITFDEEAGEIAENLGWEWESYEFWQPLPVPPQDQSK